ncbi:uncharacterized protein LOC120290605 [Eucalyptus grandis]|uniref:uncharacterized protein LOC120290605 n=1 Tax=Eucalyptus grandis TaxID=71139 RepID=UPI00192E84F9|nr:uncharacterized protein LOC120290605 [Eucalyptus grandis]
MSARAPLGRGAAIFTLPAIHLQFATHPLVRRFQLFDSPHRLGNLGVLGADQALRHRDEECCLWDDLVLGELELDVRRRLRRFLEAHRHLHFAGYHRREILELGFPDDGCNYLGHLREIRNAGGGSAFYQNPKARLDLVPKDVKWTFHPSILKTKKIYLCAATLDIDFPASNLKMTMVYYHFTLCTLGCSFTLLDPITYLWLCCVG